MSFKWYLILMGLGTGISLSALVVIIQTVDVFEASFLTLLFFYITLLLFLIGLFSILGVLYRVGVKKSKDLLLREVQVSFRHSVLFALIVVASLWFSAEGMLHWYILFPMLILAVIIEYIFLLLQEARR